MNIDLSEFDFSSVEPSSFGLIPNGKYVAMITSVEKRETKAGTGHYLAMRFDIIDGKYKGRVVFNNLNLWNPNPQAVKMSQRDMAGICRAVGVMTPKDASELANKAIGIQLGARNNDYKGEQENYIKGYMPASEVPVEPSQGAAAPQQQQGGGQQAPWM
jgi:hypothetical protein